MKIFRFMPLFAPDTGAEEVILPELDFNNESSLSPSSLDMSFEEAMGLLDNPEQASGPKETTEEKQTSVEDEAKETSKAPQAEEEVSAEASAEAEAEEETAEAEEKGASFDPSVFREVLPGAVIESPDDVVEHIRGYQERDQMLGAFEQLMERNPELLKIVEAVGKGESLRGAVTAAVDGVEYKEIDPDEDPELYAQMLAEKARLDERKKLTQEQIESQKAIEKRITQEAEAAFEDFAKRMEMDKAQQAAFLEEFNTLFRGDTRTGRFRRNAFDIIQHGLNYEKDMKAARQEAKKEGFDEGVRSVMKKKKKLPNAPAQIDGSHAAPEPDGAEGARSFAQSLLGEGDWYAQAKKRGMVQEIR